MRLIIHLQFGCFLSCSCLCSSLRRQGLAFLARSTGSVSRLITREVVVLRLQGSIFRSEAGSVCHSPPQRQLPSPDGRSGSLSPLSGNQIFRYYRQVYHYPNFVLSLSYKSRKLPHKNICVNLCFLPILSPVVPLQYFNFSLLY